MRITITIERKPKASPVDRVQPYDLERADSERLTRLVRGPIPVSPARHQRHRSA